MELPFDLDGEVVPLIKGRRFSLPTYPGVALQLQQVIGSGNFGVNELSRLVEADQALAAAVMRTANTVLYGSPVTTLAAAIARVGANSLTNLAFAATLGLQASIEGPLVSLRKDTWRRSLMSALICQHLAPRRKVDAGEAFLAGLLHDFGETIACACFETLLEAHPQSRPLPAASWLQFVQRYHVELGLALCAAWRLPEYVSTVVRRHHEYELQATEYPGLVQLVTTSDTLCARLTDARSVDEMLLSGIPGLEQAEHAALKAVLVELPAFLDSFDVTFTYQRPLSPVPSMVAPSPSTLGDHSRPVRFPLAVVTRDARTTYQAVAMSPTAVRMEGDVPQPERRLIHVELAPEVTVYATVTRCVNERAHWVIEVKPFAMDRSSQAAWSHVLSSAPSA